MKKLALLCVAVFLFTASLSVQAQDLYISGAASLTNAFEALKDAFQKKYSGITIYSNYAASNPLLRQIKEGAPADVFASADLQTMDKAAADKLIDTSTRKNFARNDLVLIVPADSKLPINNVQDLIKVKKLAIGNPASVPAGRYAKAALAQVWDSVEAKCILAASVRQCLDYVVRAEVDAGVVYRTDAIKAGEKVKVVATLEGDVLYPIAVALTGKNRKDGAAFVAFVLSKEGQAILKKFGFAPAQ